MYLSGEVLYASGRLTGPVATGGTPIVLLMLLLTLLLGQNSLHILGIIIFLLV
jgi:hypothetical protein